MTGDESTWRHHFWFSVLGPIAILDAIFHNKHPNNLAHIILINTPLALFTSHLSPAHNFCHFKISSHSFFLSSQSPSFFIITSLPRGCISKEAISFHCYAHCTHMWAKPIFLKSSTSLSKRVHDHLRLCNNVTKFTWIHLLWRAQNKNHNSLWRATLSVWFVY